MRSRVTSICIGPGRPDMYGRPSSLLDKLVSLCITVLVGATALYIAVHLIEAIWTALLVIGAVGAFIGLAVVALRSRSHDRW